MHVALLVGGLLTSHMSSIVIYLNLNGARQAVAVREVGLSSTEAVHDWAATQRQIPGPFEVPLPWCTLPLRHFARQVERVV